MGTNTTSEDAFAEVKAHQLQNRSNYLEWRRYFDRTAKSLDVWEILSGNEKIMKKEPNEDDCIVFVHEQTSTRSKTTDTGLEAGAVDGPRSLLKFQMVLEKWKVNKTKVRLARTLIVKSVCDAIAIEVEDMTNPCEATLYLKTHYGISEEKARVDTLLKVSLLKLDDCKSVTDYVNKHREFKNDLLRMKYKYDDSMMTTNILVGLPDAYADFRKRWDWKRAEDPVKEPDLHFLTDRLLAEEADIILKRKVNKRKTEKVDRDERKTKDRKCTHPGCPNPTTHNTDRCWTAHPEKKPKGLKDKEGKRAMAAVGDKESGESKTEDVPSAKKDTGRKFAAVANLDLGTFLLRMKETAEAAVPPTRESDYTLATRGDAQLEPSFGGGSVTGFKLLTDEEAREMISRTPILSAERLHDNPFAFPQTGGSRTTGFRLMSPCEAWEKTHSRQLLRAEYRLACDELSLRLEMGLVNLAFARDLFTRRIGRTTRRHLRAIRHLLSQAQNKSTMSDESVGEDSVLPDGIFPERTIEDHEHVTKFSAPNDAALHAFAAAQATKLDADSWLVDSGANMHIANNKKWFSNLTRFEIKIETVEKSTAIHVVGGGTCRIPVIGQNGVVNTLELSEVAYAPSAACNLLSMSLLAKRGKMRGSWGEEGITIQSPDGEMVGRAPQHDGLYHLDVIVPGTKEDEPSGLQAYAAIDLGEEVWRWHRRLGHLSWQGMRNLLKVSDGCPLTDEQIRRQMKVICPVCAVTKALVRIPRDPARRRAHNIGELIHADVWGPHTPEGYDGTRFFLFFVDDYSRYTWARAFSKDDQMPAVFKSLHQDIEKSHGVTIRNYRFDGQFQVGKVRAFTNRHHIGTENTIPYQHHMAGVAERNMRTIREKANPMLTEGEVSRRYIHLFSEKSHELLRNCTMPELLWPEAIKHALWQKNRAPTRAHKNATTPWELVYGLKPSLAREWIFGSRVYVTLPPETGRNQLSKVQGQRGWLGYYVGCESESVYRIYSDEKHRVFRVSTGRVEDGEGTQDPHRYPPAARPDVADPGSIGEVDRPLDPDDGSEASDTESHEEVTETVVPEQELPGEVSQLNEAWDDNFWDDTEEGLDPDNLQPRDEAETTPTAGTSPTISEDDRPGETVSRFFAFLGSHSGDGQKTKFEPKCRRCYQSGRSCFRNSLDEACRGCIGSKRKCVNNLVGARAPKEKVIKLELEFQPRCRRCLQLNRLCLRNSIDEECSLCVSTDRKCKTDVPDGVTPGLVPRQTTQKRQTAIEKRTAARHLAIQSDRDPSLTCPRCRRRSMLCDLKRPCANCVKAGAICQSSRKMQAVPCMRCRTKRRGRGAGTNACNRQRPCSRCIQKKFSYCAYMDQEGLVVRKYAVPGGRSSKLAPQPQNDEDPECTRCIAFGLRCDKGTPCMRCMLKSRPLSCIYNRPGGVREHWTVIPYHRPKRTDTELKLRDDWQTLLKMYGKKAGSRLADTSQANENDGQAARPMFSRAFPHGYGLVANSADNLNCGFYALRDSLVEQTVDMPIPSVQRLRNMWEDGDADVAEFEAELLDEGRTNHNNLHADQIAALLQAWGRQHNRVLRLGIVMGNGSVWLTTHPDPSAEVVWINNNAVTVDDTTINHWEGIRNYQIVHGFVSQAPPSPSAAPEEPTSDPANVLSSSSDSDSTDEEVENFSKHNASKFDDDLDYFGDSPPRAMMAIGGLGSACHLDDGQMDSGASSSGNDCQSQDGLIDDDVDVFRELDRFAMMLYSASENDETDPSHFH